MEVTDLLEIQSHKLKGTGLRLSVVMSQALSVKEVALRINRKTVTSQEIVVRAR